MQSLLPNIYTDIKESKILYNQGWPKDVSLKESLKNTLNKDMVLKHTTTGPHRADILFSAGPGDLKNVSSMSTQIISSLLMVMSQARVFHVKHEHSPIILIDDLFFGIDDKNLQLVINLLKSSKAQCFITAPDLYRDKLEDIIGNNNVQMYVFDNNKLVDINNDKQ
jgi:DNA replication and repair protein RecF